MHQPNVLVSINVFISVVESGSFSESARRLSLSQPSISRQINALESHLGVRLLQRTTRCLSLTEAGQIYYDKARDIQRLLLEANQSVIHFHDKPAGLLKISAPYTWAEMVISPYLGEFLSLYPDIQLDLQCNDQLQDMVADQLDLVFRVGRAVDSSYIAVPFADVELILCATPAYIQQHGAPKTIADLHNHPFITYQNFSTVVCTTSDDQYLVELNSRIKSHSVAAIISSVQQHVGLSVLPNLLVDQSLQQGEFQRLLPNCRFDIKGLPIDQAFVMYPSRQKMPPKVRVFIDFYRDKFACWRN